MPLFNSEEIEICHDCVIAIDNDDYTGLDDEYIQSIQDGIRRLSRKGNIVVSDDPKGFCIDPCECCGGLAGDRFSASILVPQPESPEELVVQTINGSYNDVSTFFDMARTARSGNSNILLRKFFTMSPGEVCKLFPEACSKIVMLDLALPGSRDVEMVNRVIANAIFKVTENPCLYGLKPEVFNKWGLEFDDKWTIVSDKLSYKFAHLKHEAERKGLSDEDSRFFVGRGMLTYAYSIGDSSGISSKEVADKINEATNHAYGSIEMDYSDSPGMG